MKKNYLSILFALVLFVSCKKSEDITENNNPDLLHNVSFNVAGFSQKVIDIDMKSSAKISEAESEVSFIVYCIYSNDVLLKKVEQTDKSATNFGMIEEQLPAGSYKIAIAAGTRKLTVLNQELFSSAFISNPSFQTADIFVKTLEFRIDDKDHQENIQVERIVGKLELSLLDKIPSDVTKITLKYKSAPYYNFQATYTGLTNTTEEIQILDSHRSSIGSIFHSFVMPVKGSGSITTDVTISCYNSKNDVIVNKVIKDVVFETNKKTILSGKLFQQASNLQSYFRITIPSTWTEGKTIDF